jgi:hypothetical protein
LLLAGLQELNVLCATEMTVEGLACLTGLTKLTRLMILGSKIRFESNKDSDSDSDDDSTAPKYEDVTLSSKVSGGSYVTAAAL